MLTFVPQKGQPQNTLLRIHATSTDVFDRVLLIEDSEDAMLLVHAALEGYGGGRYMLEWADTLTDGLKRLSKGGVDVVLLDLGLPESTGAASYTSAHEIAGEVPIVVLTGDTTERTEISVSARGVDHYLLKQRITGSLLLKTIRQALYGTKRRERESRAQTFRWARDTSLS